MNAWQFFDKHWFLAIILGTYLFGTLALGLKVFMYSLKSLMILVRGWPPQHLDADGDWGPNADTK